MTGGWPLAVQLAAEVLRRGGPIDHSALVDRLLAPDAVLFEYLAEEVLAGLPSPSVSCCRSPPGCPTCRRPCSPRSGATISSATWRRSATPGSSSSGTCRRPDRYRASVLGGEFVRRVVPAPPSDRARRDAVRAFGQLGEMESALVLCAEVGDADLALDVVLGAERSALLAAPEALAGALRLAEDDVRAPEGSPSCRAISSTCAASGTTPCAPTSGRPGSATPPRPRLARKRGVILYLRGLLDDAEAAYAAGRVDGSDPAEEAQLLAWRSAIRWIRADIDGCETLVEQAAVAAAECGDDAALATLHTTRAMVAAMHGDRRTNAEEYRRALYHAEQSRRRRPDSCASTPTAAATTPRRAATSRRSPSSTGPSRSPS